MSKRNLLFALFILYSSFAFAQRNIDYFEPDFDPSYCLHQLMYFEFLGASSSEAHNFPMPYHISQFFSKSALANHVKTIEKITTFKNGEYNKELQTFDKTGHLVMLQIISHLSTKPSKKKTDTLYEKYDYSDNYKKILVSSFYHNNWIQSAQVFFNDKKEIVQSEMFMGKNENECKWCHKYFYDNDGRIYKTTFEELNCTEQKNVTDHFFGYTQRQYAPNATPPDAGIGNDLAVFNKLEDARAKTMLADELHNGAPLKGTLATEDYGKRGWDNADDSKDDGTSFVYTDQQRIYGVHHYHTVMKDGGSNCSINTEYYRFDKDGRLKYRLSTSYFAIGSAGNASPELSMGYDATDMDKDAFENNEQKKNAIGIKTYAHTNLPVQVKMDDINYSYTFYK